MNSDCHGARSKATDFRNERQFATWLGITPMQHSSGGKERLLGTSKRGDTYLRTLLLHGARAVVVRTASKSGPLSQRINRIRTRQGLNIAVVAYVNQMAQMIRYAEQGKGIPDGSLSQKPESSILIKLSKK